MKKYLLILGLFLSLVGCAGTNKTTSTTYYTLTQEEINNSYIEKLPDNYKSLIKEQFRKILKDPDSAKYVFYHPVRAYSASTKKVFFLVKVEVNAKNSYGGYAGYSSYFFARDNKAGVMNITDLFKLTKIVIVDDFYEEK